jgi:diguanylate cyclase (GGDEF)-like protein
MNGNLMSHLSSVDAENVQTSWLKASVNEELVKVLYGRKLFPHFMPIASVKKEQIYGYEALIRGPSNSPLHSPVTLFEAAVRSGRLVELELLCREVIIKRFKKLGLPGRLFMNVSPISIQESDFKPGATLDLLNKEGLEPDRLVIEVTEQYPIRDYTQIREAAGHYRDMGFAIALDDLGAGYAGLRMWSELRPNYVKIDRHFIDGIEFDSIKNDFVASIFDIANSMNCQVVAEGIETASQYQTIKRIGIDFAQGYLLGKPDRNPVRIFNGPVSNEVETNDGSAALRTTDTVGSLLRTQNPISPNMTINQVGDLFLRQPKLMSLPVVENGKAIGLVERHPFLNLILSRYGRDLYGRKTVKTFMNSAPTLFRHDLLIEQASNILTKQLDRADYDFIVTRDGLYAGMGNISDLLKCITNMQIRNARYANPLSLLPGNVPIYEHIEQCLSNTNHIAVAYVDIDNFKPYNDVYGFDKGDQVIKMVARALTRNADAKMDFVGHVGGDDFIVIFKSADWKKRCNKILDDMTAMVPLFYNQDDINAGKINALDRQGNKKEYPLISLSIGVTEPDLEKCSSHNEVAELATDAKIQAKREIGNALFINRRRHI